LAKKRSRKPRRTSEFPGTGPKGRRREPHIEQLAKKRASKFTVTRAGKKYVFKLTEVYWDPEVVLDFAYVETVPFQRLGWEAQDDIRRALYRRVERAVLGSPELAKLIKTPGARIGEDPTGISFDSRLREQTVRKGHGWSQKKKVRMNPSTRKRAFVIFSEGSEPIGAPSVRTLWAGLVEGTGRIPKTVMAAVMKAARSEKRRVGPNDFATIVLVEVGPQRGEQLLYERTYSLLGDE